MSDAPKLSTVPYRWLTVIGIGEDGIAGLGDDAKRRIGEAEFVFAGKRHLQLAGALTTGRAESWRSPIEASVEAIRALRGKSVTVLASGDPFFFGMGATLARSIDPAEMTVLPAPSAFSLAASRLGWAMQDLALVSLHGRPIDLIRPHLQPCARILALTSDEKGPQALAALLTESGFGRSLFSVLEALGGRTERISRHAAADFALADINPLNLCAIEVEASPGARLLPLVSGLDDALFEHDGQITKREVRALTLSALAPRKGELLWDIGAGSGSVGIEWMLAHSAMRTIAIEANVARSQRIRRNADQCGVPGLRIVEGAAPAAFLGLPLPDAIFIGGGGSEAGVIDSAIDALRPGGRLVANAVTTEMEAVLLREHAARGGRLIRIDIARAGPIGAMTGWRPAMPVTQWAWTKPYE